MEQNNNFVRNGFGAKSKNEKEEKNKKNNWFVRKSQHRTKFHNYL